MDFADEANKLKDEAEDKGWDKKAEEEVKERLHRGDNNNQEQNQ